MMYNGRMNILSDRKQNIFATAPLRLTLFVLSLMVIGGVYLLRDNVEVMQFLYDNVSRPWHEYFGALTTQFEYSVTELLIAVVVLFTVLYIIRRILTLVIAIRWVKHVYITILSVLCVPAVLLAILSLTWSPAYRVANLSELANLEAEPVSVEELAAVTAQFAQMANTYADGVPRNEYGVYSAESEDVLARANEAYEPVVDMYAFLEAEEVQPKAMLSSKLFSMMGYTGFFSPLTGEVHVNVDIPPVSLPSTVMHEITHQRGIAEEQDCNFVGIFACLESGDAEFMYSGAVFGYILLSNALYGADYDMWAEVSSDLSESVRRDIAYISEYWAQFEDSEVGEISDAVYETFLYSQGQELGLRSYGAAVDLLVAYYD